MAGNYKTIATQPRDRMGHPVRCATHRKKFAGSGTHVVEATGVALVLHGINIRANVDSATWYMTNGAGAADAGSPDVTNPAVADYAGSWNEHCSLYTTGLKIVTADATGLVFTVHYSIVEL